MKLGYLSAILPEYRFDQVVDYAAQLGLKAVELACWPMGKATRRYAGVTHIDADCYDKAAIQEKLAETGIEISGLGYYPNPLDPDKEQSELAIAHIKKLLKVAEDLGVPILNTFIGRDPRATLSESFDAFQKVWPDIIKEAEDRGITVCIENCPMYFTTDEEPCGKNLACTPAIWQEMFSRIDSKNFALNYDPSHMIIMQMDYTLPIYQFAEKIRHIHIKDVQFYPEKYNQVGFFAPPLAYHTPKLPGLGDIDWGKFVSALNDIGYKGAAILEIEDRAYEETLQDRLDSIRLSKNFMNQYIL